MSKDSSEDRAPRARSGSAPTIYDVAKMAGVNPSTVSRALGQPGRVNVKTEAKVLAAVKELNYRRNPLASALQTGRTRTLALLIADITNPVIFGIVRGAENAAGDLGYTLVIAESQESGEREASSAERLLPSVDAFVLGTTRLADDQIRELAGRKPVVVLNREIPGVATVTPDLEPGIDQALAHLVMLGHRRLVFVAGPKDSWMSGHRWAVLQAGAHARGVEITEIGPTEPTLDGGRGVLPRVIASGASAVIAYNDLVAIGLMQAASAQGITVPGAFSVIGFDDIFGSDFTTPALTTIRSPLAQAGNIAVRRALELATGDVGDAPDEDLAHLETELVIRGSTGSSPVG